MFKKILFFTDIHFGLKSNSKQHNQDCIDFIKWAIQMGKEHGCDTCAFLGDWHHNRASVNVSTLNYSVQAVDLLSKGFDQMIMIPGNHDEHYRDTRDMNSIVWMKNYSNVRFFDDITVDQEVAVVPWLVGDEHKRIPKLDCRYMLGHFELPNFYMNAMVRMPETGELRREDFVAPERLFTGHFHKRQLDKNINYIGNCFPHNYADTNDDERGITILEWGGTEEYYAWPNAPSFRKYKLSDVLSNTDSLLLPNMYCRVEIDIDISYEEANFIKEQFVGQYGLRELSLIPQANEELERTFEGEVNFESVDSIVTSHLTQLDSPNYDQSLMLDIYRNL